MEDVIEKVTSKLQSAWISVSQASSQKLAKLLNLLDKQIDKQSKSKPCQRTIVCECYRRSCPYKPVAVRTYIRKLKNI